MELVTGQVGKNINKDIDSKDDAPEIYYARLKRQRWFMICTYFVCLIPLITVMSYILWALNVTTEVAGTSLPDWVDDNLKAIEVREAALSCLNDAA